MFSDKIWPKVNSYSYNLKEKYFLRCFIIQQTFFKIESTGIFFQHSNLTIFPNTADNKLQGNNNLEPREYYDKGLQEKTASLVFPHPCLPPRPLLLDAKKNSYSDRCQGHGYEALMYHYMSMK